MRAWGRRAMGAATAGVAIGLLAGGTGWAQNNMQKEVANTNRPAPRNIEMIPVKAQLDKALSSKKAKQGEVVTAKLEETVNIPNEVALPRNTVLLGHVDAVQASQHKSNSQVTVTFDQARLKNGQTLPIKATVMAIAAPPSMSNEEAAAGGAAPPGAADSPAMAGGPGTAGAPGAAGAGPAAAPAQPMNVPQPTTDAQAATTRHGVPGVMLQSDIHETTSATFLSKGRNVEVPDGTQMEVAITEIPPGVKLQ